MTCPPFDHHFNLYLQEWVSRHAEEHPHEEDFSAAIDELGYELYNRWLNTPAPWLNGEKPGFYFESYQDADMLVSWMRAYHEQDIPLPAPLLERIATLSDASLAPLHALIADRQASPALRAEAIGLLQEIDQGHPIDLYLTLLGEENGQGTLSAAVIDALEAQGQAALAPCLGIMDEASQPVRMALMSILSNFVRNEQVVRHAIELFESAEEERDRALCAAFLSKLGDPAALPALNAAAEDAAIPYLVYIEVRDAVDALGGSPVPEREFAGDPMYEALRGM